MVSPKLLVSLAGAFSLTLTLASPTPGEMHPAFRPSAPGDPSWYCTVRHRVVLDYFTLEGRNWNISEYGLRTVLASRGGAISNWFYEEEVKDGVQEFIAHWQLPIRMSHDVEENLSYLLDQNDAHGVVCHKVG